MRSSLWCVIAACGLGAGVLTPGPSAAQRVGDTPQAAEAEEPWRKNVGTFGAMLMLTDRPQEFLAEWSKPPAAGYLPEMKTVDAVRRGDMIAGVVLFSGCQATAGGLCDAVVEFTVTAPDGSEYARLETAELWKSPPPLTGQLQLGRAYLGVIVEPQDRLGDYQMSARVCDRVVDTCLELRRPFAAVHRMAEFDLQALIASYYLDPRPEWIESAIGALAIGGVLDHPAALPPIIGFFSEVFAGHPERLPDWRALIEARGGAVAEVLASALAAVPDPTAFLVEQEASPAKNDKLWGSYFASGDTGYLDALFDSMTLSLNPKDVTGYMTGASALWSMSSNLRQHLRIQQHVLVVRETAGQPLRSLLDKVLEMEPDALRKEMADTLAMARPIGTPEPADTE